MENECRKRGLALFFSAVSEGSVGKIKMADKSRFCELCTVEIQGIMGNAIPKATKSHSVSQLIQLRRG